MKFQKDCDFHIELAGSQDEDAAQVIVEIPKTHADAQRDLMRRYGQRAEVEDLE